MNRAEVLRPRRKELVLAAKAVMEEAFRGGVPGLNKAQLSHLISVCNEAACAEEIELYIRYQASRDKGDSQATHERGDGEGIRRGKTAVWDRSLAKSVIERVKAVMSALESDDLKVDAWRLYAVFLTREFTYQRAAHSDATADRGRGPAPGDARGGQRSKGRRQ